MPRRFLTQRVSPLALLLLSACHAQAVRPDAPPAGGTPSEAVVATVGGEMISSETLDGALAAELRKLDLKYAQERYELRRARLEQLVSDRLLQAEARKRGVDVQALLKAEVEDTLRRPTEDEVKRVFEENAERLPEGSTLDTYRGQIEELLRRSARQERTGALLERLRAEHYVRVRLSPPRTQVEAAGPSQGPPDAKVTIVEFLDFECPYCVKAHGTLTQVMEKYAGKVRLVFRNYPLSFHPNAQAAAEAALCAHEQGRFWELQEVLFQNHRALESEKLKGYAESVGLDARKLEECLRSSRPARQVEADVAAGNEAGVSGTPAYFINGVMLSGAQPLGAFERIIEQELELEGAERR
ncbi:MAG: thioredoxin domain-containing protein [Myxococcaceae bacterium]|nr:thioredoxin domain-containing protein [Myxococcaceae bacterium]MCI0671603.1 thioredoxin domain-containing protein [Myxococcaceae bacterium]